MAQTRGKRMAVAKSELRKFARERKLPPPKDEVVFELFDRYPDKWNNDSSAETATKDMCDDYLELVGSAVPDESPDKDVGTVTSRTASGFAYYVASVVRPYAEAFRELVWKKPDIPFKSPIAAAAWIETQYQQEKRADLGDETRELSGVFRGVNPDSHIWLVRDGGTLDKLRRLCDRVNYRYSQWTPELALGFILWGEYPLLSPRWSSQQSQGSGGHVITLTISAPATEDEVLEAYRAALKAQGVEKAPKRLSLNQELLLRVGYSSAESWGERLAKWRAYRAYYGDALEDYPGKADGRRDMARDFKRAEQRATWSGDAQERRNLGLYTSQLESPEQERQNRTRQSVNRPYEVRVPLEPAPWADDGAPIPETREPQKTYADWPDDLTPYLVRFCNLDADAPLGLSQDEARAVLRHLDREDARPGDRRKAAHLYDRLYAIAHDLVLRPEDR